MGPGLLNLAQVFRDLPIIIIVSYDIVSRILQTSSLPDTVVLNP